MENRNIIIILLVIIVALAAAIGFVLLNPTHAKEPCKIKITSDKEQYEGGELSIVLTDLNNTPLSREIVNITVTDKNGSIVVDNVVKTNAKGNATFDLNLEIGEYTVNVTYGGNENYTGNTTTQKLKINEEVVEEPEPSDSSSSSSGDTNAIYYDSKYNIYYNGEGVIVNPDGHHAQGEGGNYYEVKEFFDSGKGME